MKKVWQGIIVTSGILLFGIVSMKLNDRKRDALFEELNIEYPTICVAESIQGKVTSIYIPSGVKRNPNLIYVSIGETLRRKIATRWDSDIYIDETIRVGSIIEKISESNRLKVQIVEPGDTLEYFFLLANE